VGQDESVALFFKPADFGMKPAVLVLRDVLRISLGRNRRYLDGWIQIHLIDHADSVAGGEDIPGYGTVHGLPQVNQVRAVM